MSNIREVAARAGVSVATVSYALNRPERVTPELRLRVEQAVRALGYRPDGTARALRTGRSQLISLIIPDVANHFYAQLARGVHDVLKPRGFHVTVGSTDADPEEEDYFLRAISLHRAAGAIAVPFRLSLADVGHICDPTTPIVLLAQPDADVPITCIDIDNEGGADQAVTLLLAQGRRRIAYIDGLSGTPPSRRRYAGYLQAHDRAGALVDPHLRVYGDFQRAGGERAMADLLDTGLAFDGIFAANDLQAIGAMQALCRRGLRVPDDVAVVGFDDIEEAEIVGPALTTVHQPSYEAGRCAAELLLRQIDPPGERPGSVVMPTFLVRRASA